MGSRYLSRLLTINQDQKKSFMSYNFMKMYVHGLSPNISINKTDVELFLKFGLGDDYYEVTKPVYDGWDEDQKRNSFKIDLDWLTSLKDTSNINKKNKNDIFLDSANVKKYFFTDDDGQLTGEKIRIVGQPAINRLQTQTC